MSVSVRSMGPWECTMCRGTPLRCHCTESAAAWLRASAFQAMMLSSTNADTVHIDTGLHGRVTQWAADKRSDWQSFPWQRTP